MATILIVDDDQAICRMLELHLRSRGFAVMVGHDIEAGLALLGQQRFQLLILDIRMPGRSGLEGLPEILRIAPGLPVIMITAFHDMESTIQAMQAGAQEYIHKPIDIDELDGAIDRLIETTPAPGELLNSGEPETGPLRMVGRSRAMKEVFKSIGLVARGPATVLITGESGTGKELVARAIHRCSDRPGGPFVVVNCAALVENLLESEMFGHERGAFTGAVQRQPGKFALADGGTLFLDEIGELTPAIQAKLLRVLQYKEFIPLGAQQAQTTDARMIAATNVDLRQRVAEGRFREDLYYRLQVVNIHLPPLRERKEDLPDLVTALLSRINRELKRTINRTGRDLCDCLMHHDWPGNVRELENVLMKAVALSTGDTLTSHHLPATIRCDRQPAAAESGEAQGALVTLREMERRYVEQVLASVDGHRGRACEILDISRPRLRRIVRDGGG